MLYRSVLVGPKYLPEPRPKSKSSGNAALSMMVGTPSRNSKVRMWPAVNRTYEEMAAHHPCSALIKAESAAGCCRRLG